MPLKVQRLVILWDLIKQKIKPEKNSFKNKTKKSWTNLECVMCNKVISKVFQKPHYKRSDILFI